MHMQNAENALQPLPLTQSTQRIAFIDYAKAISIFYIVFIHVGFDQLNNAALFTMPFFFAATGFCFQPDKRTLHENISRRFKKILVPFWILIILYTLLEIIRAELLGYSSWRIMLPSLMNGIYGSGIFPFEGDFAALLKEIMSYKPQQEIGVDIVMPISCHLWFLPAMFTAFVFFATLAKQSLKNHGFKILAILSLLLLASIEIVFPQISQLPYGIGRGALGAIFMLVGFWLRQYRFFEAKTLRFHLTACIIAAIVFAAAIFLGSDGRLFVRSNYGPYGVWSLILTVPGGIAGILLILQLCRGIERLPLGAIKRTLSFAGNNVLTIYILHMAIKTFFDIIYIKLFASNNLAVMDDYRMGLLPEYACGYMIFTAVATIAICLLIAKRRTKAKDSF